VCVCIVGVWRCLCVCWGSVSASNLWLRKIVYGCLWFMNGSDLLMAFVIDFVVLLIGGDVGCCCCWVYVVLGYWDSFWCCYWFLNLSVLLFVMKWGRWWWYNLILTFGFFPSNSSPFSDFLLLYL
jgi:hypothetical protein